MGEVHDYCWACEQWFVRPQHSCATRTVKYIVEPYAHIAQVYADKRQEMRVRINQQIRDLKIGASSTPSTPASPESYL